MKNRSFLMIALSFHLMTACVEDGSDGKSTLTDLIVEPEGVNCAFGGIKIITGIDFNNNNILDNNEIEETEYVCNGNNGTNGINGSNSILNVINEPAGENCASGGSKIIAGVDINVNGVLDSNEIQNTAYVCNGNDGVNGSNSIFDVETEPAGDNCPTGGSKITLGLDLNNNNILDLDEIQVIEYVCSDLDKQIRIEVTTASNGTGISTALTEDWEYQDQADFILYGFDKNNYPNISSIQFGVFPLTVGIEMELYNLTDGVPIASTKIIGNQDWSNATLVLSDNIIESFPNKPVDLVLRIKSPGGIRGEARALSKYLLILNR